MTSNDAWLLAVRDHPRCPATRQGFPANGQRTGTSGRPAFSPGKPYFGLAWINRCRAAERTPGTRASPRCTPCGCQNRPGPVLQQPSGKNPVRGRSLQGSKGPPGHSIDFCPGQSREASCLHRHSTSSIQACWMASRDFSPQCLGSSSKSGSASTQARRSTKLAFERILVRISLGQLDGNVVNVGPFHFLCPPSP